MQIYFGVKSLSAVPWSTESCATNMFLCLYLRLDLCQSKLNSTVP